MRIATIDGRVGLVTPDGFEDIAKASDGRFGPEPLTVFDRWDAFTQWQQAPRHREVATYGFEELGPPLPTPRQIFALAANYADHAVEANIERPEQPNVFAKFSSCLTGPTGDVRLPSNRTDWEVELVVVIGRYAAAVSESEAWSHVAGLMVGQDISERRVQFRKGFLDLAIAKSFPTFGPTGPWVVTLDELDDPDDLEIECSINGDVQQHSRTSNMLFSVPSLIEHISSRVPLGPGDLIFTGTPAGVGSTQDPRRYLADGDVITSTIEGLGTMTNRCTVTL